MARIRTIKPEFFKSETIAGLPLAARLTFIGMWTEADDDGRLAADPVLLKAALWPRDDRTVKDIEADLSALLDAGLVRRMEARERRSGKIKTVIEVVSWREHQTINKRTRGLYDDVMTLPGLFPEESGSSPGVLREDSGSGIGTEQGTGNREEGTGTSPAKAGMNYGRIFAESFTATHGEMPTQQAIKRIARDAAAMVHKEGRDPEQVRAAVVEAAEMGHANASAGFLGVVSRETRGASLVARRNVPSRTDAFRELAAKYEEAGQ